METLTASNAKREFGEVLIKAQQAPISVTRNGKPIAVVLSNTEYEKLKLHALRSALMEGEESGDIENFSMEDIKNRLNKA